MHSRFVLLRVPPAPIGTPMFVYYHNTEVEIPIYLDRKITNVITQPIKMNRENIHFYCEENVRVDIKMVSNVYFGGYLLIKDQLMINQDTYLDRVLTLLDGTITADINGNLLVEEL